jgi:hypothetical protein
MKSIDVVLAMLRFTVYLLALLQHPHKRRQLALGGIAGAVATCAMIYVGQGAVYFGGSPAAGSVHRS